MNLKLWPSIDLRAGSVVRLLKGQAEAETRYAVDPLEVLTRFETQGADGLHIVDLDAAFGKGSNTRLIRDLLPFRTVPVQVGGGIREERAVLEMLDAGASRVVLGSVPFSDPHAFERILASASPSRIVVALDCKEGRPTIRGWVQDAAAGSAADAAATLRRLGVTALLVTDVACDGAMTGPNLNLLAAVRAVFSGEILASGGVRGPEDLPGIQGALAGGRCGVILGRALHEGVTTVAQLRQARDFALAGGPK